MKWLTVFTMLVMVLFLPGIVMADLGTGLKFGGQGYSPYGRFGYPGPPQVIYISDDVFSKLLGNIGLPQERQRLAESWLRTIEQSWIKNAKFQEAWIELQKTNLKFQREIEQLQMEKLKLQVEIEKLQTEKLQLEKEKLELQLKLEKLQKETGQQSLSSSTTRAVVKTATTE